MTEYKELCANSELQPQLTAVSEKKLILPLLENDLFDDIRINRLLSTYPSANDSQKSELICDLMQKLWDKEDLFRTFKAFDYFLALSGKRGHFVHQFEVYLLGLNILVFLKNFKTELHLDFRLTNFNEILYAWLITSTTHDFGYPVEGAHKILKKLVELYKEFDLKYLADKIGSITLKDILTDDSDLSRVLDKCPEDAEEQSFLNIKNIILGSLIDSLNGRHDDVKSLQKRLIESDRHGYASAILLTRILLTEMLTIKPYNKVKEDWKYKVLVMASGAIALHTLNPNQGDSTYINRISYNKNPLAFLLLLVDNIQDWNRSLFHDAVYPNYHLSDFKINETKFILTYHISHNFWEDRVEKIVDNFIFEKSATLNLITKPNPLFGVSIEIHFIRNDGHIYDPIILAI